MTKKILLLIPIYNEQEQIEMSIKKLIDYARVNLASYEVQVGVVDNASNDNSQELCTRMEKIYENFVYLRLEEKGRGLALKYAWSKFDFDFSIYMDADLSTDLNHILDSIKAYESGADITFGSRKTNHSNVSGRNYKRILTSWGYVNVVKLLSGSKLTDFQCGFKGISKEISKSLIPVLENRQ